MKWPCVLGLGCCCAAGALEVRPAAVAAGHVVEVVHEGKVVFGPAPGAGALRVVQPSGTSDIVYAAAALAGGLHLEGGTADGLSLSESWTLLGENLWQRTVKVTAQRDSRYYLELGWHTPQAGDYVSFEGAEPASKRYSLGFAGAGFEDQSLQTFPMLGERVGEMFFGMVGDTPGNWENRSWLDVNTEARTLTIANGDGSVRRAVSIPIEVDATSVYRAYLDGWQHIEAGQTQEFATWFYASPALNHYDVQLGAHLALANAKGFNRSGLEAVLRNTSYLLLRRNLFRPESDYIFISGVGYGWKQWVSDGFWMSRGLDDARFDAEANNAVFFERVGYEDNAQYFLIWSCLAKRAGGLPDKRTVARAYHFIRQHEHDGIYYPPRLTPEKKNMKTYHDQLEYEDDDAPSSNQGFHCGALLAAKELGFEVSEEDIEKAAAGYARMFNEAGGYFATSLKQQDRIGQDSLYGEVLTYAVFGRKLLPDAMVQRHLETTMRIQTPFGMRVISQANGDLLEGHSGVYVYGGSWFLNDGANYLDGLIHGMDAQWVDDKLLWRLERELAWMPAFHESISTVTGKPHGHHLYSWNSGFWWLRREVRARLGLPEEDPLAARLDERLGLTREDGLLKFTPGPDNLQRQP